MGYEAFVLHTFVVEQGRTCRTKGAASIENALTPWERLLHERITEMQQPLLY